MADGPATYGSTDAPTDQGDDAQAELERQRELDELMAFVNAQSNDAALWIDGDIAPLRERATRYYNGEKFGNEQEGRSSIVLTEVRDTIGTILPSLLKIFFSGEKVVEFMPNGPEDIAAAEQATDYVNYIVQKDNPGFEIFHAAFKDALKSKTGIVKWWWDESISVSTHSFEGLSQEAFIALLNEPGVELLEHSMGEQGVSAMVKRRRPRKKVTLAAVPPEEFLIERSARSIEDALYLEHRSEKTESQLIEMGYSKELVKALGADQSSFRFNTERTARNKSAFSIGNDIRKFVYREANLYYDLDGDGIAELIKVCFVGNKLLHVEPIAEKNYATFCPDPEPHTFFGTSVADAVMDLQRITSTMMRVTLDSAVQAVTQRTVINETVNVGDVMNNELGGVIRTRGDVNNSVRPLDTVFLGQQMLPLLGYMGEVKENRTGISKASMGLNADALQSSTRAAVAATVSGAQAKIELIARIFAETGMKRVFRGILRMITQKQDQARMVRLRNEWVPIDPRVWNADMDVSINVAIGGGTVEEKMGFLGLIAQKQEQIMTTVGPDNPLVNAQNLYNTYTKMLQMQGFKDPSQFFTDPQSYQPPPPKPDPAEMLAQIEMEKNRATMAVEGERLRLDREKYAEDADFKRDQLDAEIILRTKEMELQYNQSVDVAKIRAEIEKEKALAPPA